MFAACPESKGRTPVFRGQDLKIYAEDDELQRYEGGY